MKAVFDDIEKYELEVRFPVKDIEGFKQKIDGLGAKFDEVYGHMDWYYYPAGSKMPIELRNYRIRQFLLFDPKYNVPAEQHDGRWCHVIYSKTRAPINSCGILLKQGLKQRVIKLGDVKLDSQPFQVCHKALGEENYRLTIEHSNGNIWDRDGVKISLAQIKYHRFYFNGSEPKILETPKDLGFIAELEVPIGTKGMGGIRNLVKELEIPHKELIAEPLCSYCYYSHRL